MAVGREAWRAPCCQEPRAGNAVKMGATPSPAAVVAGAAAAVQRSRQTAHDRLRYWLPVILFTVLIGAQTVARTGDFAGFVDSTKPVHNRLSQIFAADGYIRYWEGIPVHGDATSFLALTRFLQGQQGPENTGIYDLRAGYAYVGALASLLLGHYRTFVALNALAWLGAALAMYWLGERLLNSRLAAWTAGTLTATGLGFSFAVGTPVATLVAFASVAAVLAFVEWVGLFRPPFRWRDWLHAGWLIAAASLIYPVHLALLGFIGLYGLRRAPFVRLVGLGTVTVALAQAWPTTGATIVGLQLDTTNSALIGTALHDWWSALLPGLRHFLHILGTAPSAGTIYAAFPGLMLLAAAYGYVVAEERVRQWTLALCLITLLPAMLFTILFAIPRTAFFAYPAIYLLAAVGVTQLAQATASWRLPGRLSPVVVILGLLLLVIPSVAALVGYGGVDSDFHHWTPRWTFAANE